MTEDKAYKLAKKRVEDLKGFYIHFAIFVIVNLGLALLNFVQDKDSLWFYWITFGWGIGVAIHFIVVFVFEGIFGPDWEQRQIEKRVKKEKPEE